MSGIKKYFSTGLLALLTTAYLTSSCSREDFSGSVIDAKKQAFSDNFRAAYGDISPTQDWGFGSASTRTRAFTRGADLEMPGTTSFRDNLDNLGIEPEMPDFPDYLPSSGVTYGGSVTTWENGMSVYLNKDYTWADGNKTDLVIYINDDLTFTGGLNNGGDGTTIIVLKGKKLTLNTTAQNMKIYLAPGATLDMSGTSFQQFNNEKAGLFMKAGSKVIAGELDFFQGWKVLNQGGYIKATNLYVQKGSVLWNEGEIKLSGALATQNEDGVIYNGADHQIKASSLTLHNNSELFYNDGTAVFTGAIAQDNDGGEIINNDTLKGASMVIKAGGKMHNVGYTKITNKTTVDNDETEWQNDGQFTTGDFEVSSYAQKVYNNCKLTVHKKNNTGEFKIYGKFVMAGGDPEDDTKSGASLVTDNLNWVNNSYMYLGAKSMIYVKEQFLSNNYDINAAIVGPTEGYAVVRAKSITRPESLMAKQFGMTYLNNLYVDADSHFPQGAEDPMNGQPAQPYYAYDETVKFKHLNDVAPSITIPKTECNPGYNGGGGGTTKVELLESGRVFCEDLGNVSNKDMDYNDVVFDAWIYVKRTYDKDGHQVGADQHYRTFIQLLAAGGTLPINVANKGDVHTLFGDNSNKMINTFIPGINNLDADLCVTINDLPDEIEIRNELDEFYARTDKGGICIRNIPIFVYQSNEVFELEANPGDAPHKFWTPIGTKWAGERIMIHNAYTGFSDWVHDKDAVPWGTGVEGNLYDITYTHNHGDEMDYDPDDDPSLDDNDPDNDGDDDDEEEDDEDEDEDSQYGEVAYVATTPNELTTGDGGVQIGASHFDNASAATVYVIGTGEGDVYVNGAPTEAVSSYSAPRFNFTRGLGFTRSMETPVVRKCILGPNQMYVDNNVVITGNNFAVSKVCFDTSLPSVKKPAGDAKFTGNRVMNWSVGQCKIPAAQLAGIGAGTVIRVAGVGFKDNVNANTENDTSWQLELDVEKAEWSKIGDNRTYWDEYKTGAITASWTLTKADADALVNNTGLVVQGVNFILLYVTVDNSNVTTPSVVTPSYEGTVLWSSTTGEAVGNGGTIDLTNTDNIGTSGTLRFYLTHTGNSGQITATSADGWSTIYSGGYSVGVTYGQNKDFTLTDAMCEKLKDEKKIKLAGQDLVVNAVTYIPPTE